MNRLDRRTFLLCASACGVAASTGARAQNATRVQETEPQAVALGYKDDTTKVDEKKFPKHTAAQKCNGCQFYSGKANDATGPCAIFGGRHVSAVGWCSSWIKKAG